MARLTCTLEQFESSCQDRIDELLEIEARRELTADEEMELDALNEWDDVYQDYLVAVCEITDFYESQGVRVQLI